MARRKKSDIPKGLPEKLHNLFIRGERYRFNGFWLDETPKDRSIANWLDRQKENDVDLGEVVKNYLYELSTGEVASGQEKRLREMESVLYQLLDLIKSGVYVRGNSDVDPDHDVDDLLAKLTGFGT